MLISLMGPAALIIFAAVLGNTQVASTCVKLVDGALHPLTEGARLAQRLFALLDKAPLEAMCRLALILGVFNLLPVATRPGVNSSNRSLHSSRVAK